MDRQPTPRSSEQLAPAEPTDPDRPDRLVPGPDADGPPPVDAPPVHADWRVRVFGSRAFFRLWIAQVVSATGDWLGLLAIIDLAARVGGTDSIALVIAARIIPGFFLATVGGVIVDRFNRKRVMIFCDVGRALVLVSLPFVDSVLGLVVASFILELLTLLWSPAKEASVPNIVPTEHLAAANSLSVAAAYGTYPLGAGLFALLAKVSAWQGDSGWVDTWRINQEGLAFYVDALTFVATAVIISTIALPARSKEERRRGTRRVDFGEAWRELREGWQYIFIDPRVRAVNVGLATGLIGGGMLIPLGTEFAEVVLGGGRDATAVYGLLQFMLGIGMAVAVVSLPFLQARLPKELTFVAAVFVAGIALVLAVSMSTLPPAATLVGLIGVSAGTVYVLGFTLLQESVADDLRGRIFSALFTLVRLCVLIALFAGPLLSGLLDEFSREAWDSTIDVFGMTVFVPGVRLTLWLAGFIIIGAGFLALFSLRRQPADDEGVDPEPDGGEDGARLDAGVDESLEGST